MNKKVIAYTLLKNYNNYENIIDSVNKSVRHKATKSHTTTYSYSGCYQTVEALTQNIIDLIEKKRYIINCRLLVLQALENLSQKDANILKLKFFEKKTFEQIGELLNVAPAQSRREVVKSFRNFYCSLASLDGFREVCESEFCFFKPLNVDYMQSLNSERLMKMGLFN